MKFILAGAALVMMASCAGNKSEVKSDTDTVTSDSVVGFIEDMPADSSGVVASGDGVAVK